MLKTRLIAVLACVLGASVPLARAEDRAATAVIDWPAFMARHDLVCDTLPHRWQDGAFLGNGLLGLMIYQPSKPNGERLFGFDYRPEEANSLRFDLGRSDVIDHRGPDVLQERGRLPIGHFLMTPVGKIVAGRMRLDLWNAQAFGTIATDRGEIRWRAFVPAQRDAIIVEFEPSEGERDARWEYVAAISESSRVYRDPPKGFGAERPQDQYPANPPAERSARGEIQIARQPMLAGGDYTTAWKMSKASATTRRVCIAIGYNRQISSVDEAIGSIVRAEQIPFEQLEAGHRQWWHRYLSQSFVSVPDARIESFYWIQMYKLGAATRADKPAIDLMGPWYRNTIWPAMWWNLNLQLTYYPVYTANRLNIGESLVRMIDDNAEKFVENAPTGAPGGAFGGAFAGIDFNAFEGRMAWVARATASGEVDGGMFKGQRSTVEMGNLTWALHNYWRQCRYAADDERLREQLLPLLRAAINFYRPMLERDGQGVYHLRPTFSPEYGYGPDCNYDLALLKWGLQTLIAESARLGVEDSLTPQWRDIHDHLADYPIDENGFMVARDLPFRGGHRHYSHLLMFYPLYVVNWEQPERRELLQRSVDHWAGEANAFAGYSYSGAASMYASMEQGDKVLRYLNGLIDRSLTPNTMYMEAESPVIESPLSGAASVQDMLLQSWSVWVDDGQTPAWVSTIRVFPGVPSMWSDVAFADLRAEGAFLVSAQRAGGETQWVQITSLAGWPCRVRPGLEGPVHAIDPAQNERVRAQGAGLYQLDLRKGETIVLYGRAAPPSVQIRPAKNEAGPINYFGSRAVKSK